MKLYNDLCTHDTKKISMRRNNLQWIVFLHYDWLEKFNFTAWLQCSQNSGLESWEVQGPNIWGKENPSLSFWVFFGLIASIQIPVMLGTAGILCRAMNVWTISFLFFFLLILSLLYHFIHIYFDSFGISLLGAILVKNNY